MLMRVNTLNSGRTTSGAFIKDIVYIFGQMTIPVVDRYLEHRAFAQMEHFLPELGVGESRTVIILFKKHAVWWSVRVCACPRFLQFVCTK